MVAWNHAIYIKKYFNYEVHILTFGNSFKMEKKEGIIIHYVPKRKLAFEYYLTIGRNIILKIAETIKPDVIHQHIPQIFGYILSDFPSIKVATIHDGLPEHQILQNLSFYKRLRYLIIRRWLNFRRMDAITSVSLHNTKYMQERYGSKFNFITIPNGIDTDYFKPLVDVKKKGYVLYVGRLLRRKGVDNLIEASKLLPEIDFKFIGKGHLSKEIKGKNLEYLGFVDNLPRYYNEATVCIFPSNSENYPLVGLEAMACGTPIITTSVGFSEYVNSGNNGIILENNSPESIASAINTLTTDKELMEEIKKKGLATANDSFWPKIVSKYNSLYQDIKESKANNNQ